MSTLTSELHNIIGSKATNTSYGLAKVSESTTVTETNNGLVLSAKEKNPAVSGTIANEVLSIKNSVGLLGERMVCNENIKDISEIFDYKKHDLSLFSNWKGSALCPKNFSMVLRIPNLDSRNAKCLCMHNTTLYVGELNFANRTIDWTEK